MSSLEGLPSLDPEISLQFVLLKIDYYSRLEDFGKAMEIIHSSFPSPNIEPHDSSPTPGKKDTCDQILLLTTKALLYSKSSSPQKGLTAAIRATIAAMMAKTLPALWEAVAALGKVLISIGDPQAADEVVHSVVWQASYLYHHRYHSNTLKMFATLDLMLIVSLGHGSRRY